MAEYPWRAVKTLVGQEPPGAILCCDTRVSDGEGYIFPMWLAKQRSFSPNLIACYTSSNIYVTTAALDRESNTRNVKRLGDSLRELHKVYGGITELIIVVCRKGATRPQILEVMPKAYKPVPRRGVIGIGDTKILQRFRELFKEDPSNSCPIEPTPEMIENISRAVGHQVDFGCRFPLQQAAAEIVSALSQAVEEVQSLTVELPLQVTTISKAGVSSKEAMIRRGPGAWERLTARHAELSLPANPPVRSPSESRRRAAVQLFE